MQKIKKMMEADPAIGDKSAKDVIYVISPFANVAYQLAQKLKEIGFTRFDNSGSLLTLELYTYSKEKKRR